ncbi:hypothetical protein I598_1895 [Isoptericola dokdonensis DS-3]|uniref:Uncharacterized protein n=1 Tax=Isoptericola dokdonensis DS-3 TaxID=1300344 RepID=A0A161HYF1_9MICO|nr:hypothetical protein I598_1895 [Isoptericola dokdonensis DS-3]
MFGVRRQGYAPVVVKRVWIPHHATLVLANESAFEGPFPMRRGEAHFFHLAGVEAPVDVVVVWRWRLGRKERFWSTWVL